MPGVVRFGGSTGWCKTREVTEARIERAILRSADEFVLECHFQGYRYTATLRRTSGSNFRGEFTATGGSDLLRGEVECALMLSGPEGLLLGTWKEERDSYQWWAALKETEHFPDETASKRV